MTRRHGSKGVSLDWETEYAGRARGLAGIAFVAIAMGAGLRSATILLFAVPLVGYLLYDRLAAYDPPAITYERTVESRHPLPGREIEVTVSLHNESDQNAPDLRVIDGVPEGLAVVDGSARASLSLAPGESDTFSYTIRTRRGTHRFEDTTVISRNLRSSWRSQATAADSLEIESHVEGDTVGLRDRTSMLTGTRQTASGGAGVEFHSTREYHPSDPISRIDWRRLAAGGGLTTVTYREPKTAVVQLIVDRRVETVASFSDQGLTHRENVSFASEVVANALLADYHQVGLTAVGADWDDIDPMTPVEQRQQLRTRFDEMGEEDETVIEQSTARAVNARADGGSASSEPLSSEALQENVDRLVERTPSYTQFILFSSLYDGWFEPLAERLRAHDRDILLISPRQRAIESKGQRIMAAERRLRIDSLRRRDVTVIDWDTNEPLRFAIDRVFEGRR